MKTLKSRIEVLYENHHGFVQDEFNAISAELIDGLNSGSIRAAEPAAKKKWIVNQWVKHGILLLFRHGSLHDMSDSKFNYYDKNTLPLHPFTLDSGVRIVPGGSAIRTGSYVASGVICMPPMYVNIGAYIDSGTMIDSHALVGTCAQIGRDVHLSAASQVGGVLEPAGARPVIIEDGVMVGGNCGIYEGVRVRRRAVLASGVILTASTRVYDIVNNRIISSSHDTPLEIPENAVVIAGSRELNGDFAEQHKLSAYCPIIVKYRDEKTDSKTALEAALR